MGGLVVEEGYWNINSDDHGEVEEVYSTIAIEYNYGH